MSNTAPSRADPMVVFPLSRWCPPQETSQPYPPPATATGDSWTTKVVYLLVKKWWKIKNFRHPLIGCFTFLPLFLQSALSLSVSICLGWRMPSSAGWFSGNTLKTLITEPSIISKSNIISISFSIYLYSHNMISYTNIYICTYVWIFVCFCWGLNKYYSFKLQQILFHLFFFIHIAVHVYWLLTHWSYCSLALSYQFNV